MAQAPDELNVSTAAIKAMAWFFENSLDVFLAVRRNGHTKANPTWKKLTGWDLPEVRGQSFWDFVHPAWIGSRTRPMAPGSRRSLSPYPYTTLSSARARPLILEFFKAAQATVQHGLIGEVCDIDGVLPSALQSAVASIRPYCLFAVGQITDVSASNLRSLREAMLHGVTIECPSLGDSEAEFIGWTQALIKASHPKIRSVIAYRLASWRSAAIAGALGVTHASLAA